MSMAPGLQRLLWMMNGGVRVQSPDAGVDAGLGDPASAGAPAGTSPGGGYGTMTYDPGGRFDGRGTSPPPANAPGTVYTGGGHWHTGPDGQRVFVPDPAPWAGENVDNLDHDPHTPGTQDRYNRGNGSPGQGSGLPTGTPTSTPTTAPAANSGLGLTDWASLIGTAANFGQSFRGAAPQPAQPDRRGTSYTPTAIAAMQRLQAQQQAQQNRRYF